MCVDSAWTSTTRGWSSGIPPVSWGKRNWADGKLRCSFHAARSTCIHALNSSSSSASVHGTRAAEYRKRAAATIRMAGTIKDRGTWWSASNLVSSFVELRT